MKKILLVLLALLNGAVIYADEMATLDTVKSEVESVANEKKKQPIMVKLELRMDWEGSVVFNGPSATNYDNFESGITGKYLDLHFNGNITDKLSYGYRQRLNKSNVMFGGDGGSNWFFKSIDKAVFNYDFNPQWGVTAGKVPLAYGGWEYDAPPIDLFMPSTSWNNIYCFQFAVRGYYNSKSGKNTLLAEVGNSIFTPEGRAFAGLYSYSLLWYGRFGCFNSAYSLNIEEYDKGKFLYGLSLGNRFNAGPLVFDADLVWRYAGFGKVFDDFSVIGKITGKINGWGNVFAKAGYERNFSNDISPLVVVPYGTQDLFYGIGGEVCPIKKKDFFRLHAYIKQYVCIGQNEKFGADNMNGLQFAVGATLRIVAIDRK